MKAAIVYASTHHGNTKKLVDAIARKYPVTVFDAEAVPAADLAGYDLIGFASGIAWGKFYESVERFAQASLPEGKQVFFLYTCADDNRNFAASLCAIAAERGAEDLGTYACKGFNAYGPWKLVGGMNKKHPTADEIQGAKDFCGVRKKSFRFGRSRKKQRLTRYYMSGIRAMSCFMVENTRIRD